MNNVVNGKIKKSVDNFVKELQNKINDLSNMREQNKKLTSDYEHICEIINQYIIVGSPLGLRKGDIIFEDVLKFNPRDLKEILELIGCNDKNIIESYDEKRTEYLNTRNSLKKEELAKYFTSILAMIDHYIEEYNVRYVNQVNFETSKAEKYKRYIDMFTSKEFSYSFGENELKELKLLMSECSLDSYTKAQILEYVNIKAIDFALKGNKTVDDYDFKSHVYYLVANYLKDEKYVNIVRKEMPPIDYETLVFIKEEGKRIAAKYGLDPSKTINTLVALAINSLYKKYEYCIENSDNEEISIETNPLREAIKMLEGFFVNAEQETINMATSLVVEYEKDLNEHGAEAEMFLDKTMEEILELGYSKEKAIVLKTLPLIKGIKESIDILADLRYEEEIKERTTYLVELMNMYYETKMLAEQRVNNMMNK